MFQNIPGLVRIRLLRQHKNQPPRTGLIPTVPLGMFIAGEIGCFHPANNRYAAKSIHQRIQSGCKGSGGYLFRNRLIVWSSPVERLGDQIPSLLHRLPIAAEVEHVEVTPNPHMMRPQSLVFVSNMA